MHLFRRHFESFHSQVDLLPTMEPFFNLNSKSHWLPLLLVLLPHIDVDPALLVLANSPILLASRLRILNGDGYLKGSFVETDLFGEGKGVEGVLEVVVNHEFSLLSSADGHEGESLELISDFVVHEHDQFLEDPCLGKQVVILQQVRTVETLFCLFFVHAHISITIFRTYTKTT